MEDLQITLQILKWLFGGFGLIMLSVQSYNAFQLNRINESMRQLDLSSLSQEKDIQALKKDIDLLIKSKDKLAHDMMVRQVEIDSCIRSLEERINKCRSCNIS